SIRSWVTPCQPLTPNSFPVRCRSSAAVLGVSIAGRSPSRGQHVGAGRRLGRRVGAVPERLRGGTGGTGPLRQPGVPVLPPAAALPWCGFPPGLGVGGVRPVRDPVARPVVAGG